MKIFSLNFGTVKKKISSKL